MRIRVASFCSLMPDKCDYVHCRVSPTFTVIELSLDRLLFVSCAYDICIPLGIWRCLEFRLGFCDSLEAYII